MDTVQLSQAISLHRGSSSIEVLYVPKDRKSIEKEKPSSWLEQFGLTRCTFAAAQLDEAIKHLKQHTQDSTKDGTLEIRATGFGNMLFESNLNARFVSLPKWECSARGFAHLRRNVADAATYLERGTVDHRNEIEASTNIFEMAAKVCENKFHLYLEVTEAIGKLGPEEFYKKSPLLQQTTSDSESDPPPSLLVVCGSQTSFLKVYKCGRYELLDADSTGVASFRGLGRLLSGYGAGQERWSAKSLSRVTEYKRLEKLAQVAAEGDARQVDFGMFDVAEVVTSNDDFYGQIKSEDLVDDVLYSFGKTPGESKDDFKKPDVVRALTQLFASDLAQLSIRVAAANKIKDVVYCGSLFEEQLFKDIFAAWFMKKRIMITMFSGEVADLNLHFLRHGSCIEPFGALLCEDNRHTETSRHPLKPDTLIM